MDLSVGIIEDKLRKFPKNTSISISCSCCNHSSSGNESILSITDNTNQTYGYIELNFNDSSKAEVKLSTDKEKFYTKEIEKLNKIIKTQERKLNDYKEHVEDKIKSDERALKWIEREEK